MNVDAFTIDTSTIQRHGFRFDKGWLHQLKQFKTGPVTVVISEVVVEEVTNHLADYLRDAHHRLSVVDIDALEHALPWPAPMAPRPPFDPQVHARDRVNAFLQDIGAVVIPVAGVAVDVLLQKYLRREPPFADATKKHEFPDAMALMSLDRWAEENGRTILVVSGDKAWANYGKESQYLEVTNNLKDALSGLQRETAVPAATAQQALGFIASNPAHPLRIEFDRMLERAVEMLTVDGNVDSEFNVEIEQTDTVLADYSLSPAEATVVRVFDNTVVVSIPITLTLDVRADLSFGVWDSIDKEIVGMGSTDVSRDGEKVLVTALVEFTNDPATNQITIDELSAEPKRLFVDFGYVHPDWGDD